MKNLETKKVIRNCIIKKRSCLSNEEWAEKSVEVLGKLMHHPLYEKAETIYCYVSYQREVDTWPFLAYSIALGKKVAVPKVLGSEMEFFYIDSLEELEPGFHGIYEPVTSKKANEEEVLMIMPIVAFDCENHRLGYGGGYYDRYLEKHPLHTKIGIAFDFQQVEEIPAESFDIKPNLIITDKKKEEE